MKVWRTRGKPKSAKCLLFRRHLLATTYSPCLHNYVSFDDIHIFKYPFLKTFQIWKYISNKYTFSFLITKRHFVMRKENIYIYIYIYIEYLIFYFQIATFFKMVCIFIVFFLDGKIADRQINNSSNSLIQSRSDFFFNQESIQQISCCQTSMQEFGRGVKGRFLVKGNKDKKISRKRCDGEENVNR